MKNILAGAAVFASASQFLCLLCCVVATGLLKLYHCGAIALT